jgi:hypothetical protein
VEFFLEALILFWEERLGKVLRLWWEIVGENEARLEGVTIVGEVIEQTTETEHILLASLIGQGAMLFAQTAEPAEQMGMAAQLGQPQHLRKLCVEIGEEASDRTSIVVECAVLQGSSEDLDAVLEHLLQV